MNYITIKVGNHTHTGYDLYSRLSLAADAVSDMHDAAVIKGSPYYLQCLGANNSTYYIVITAKIFEESVITILEHNPKEKIWEGNLVVIPRGDEKIAFLLSSKVQTAAENFALVLGINDYALKVFSKTPSKPYHDDLEGYQVVKVGVTEKMENKTVVGYSYNFQTQDT